MSNDFRARPGVTNAELIDGFPRPTLTADALRALPDLSVVIDRDNDVWQKRGDQWCSFETRPFGSDHLAKKYAPLRLMVPAGGAR